MMILPIMYIFYSNDSPPSLLSLSIIEIVAVFYFGNKHTRVCLSSTIRSWELGGMGIPDVYIYTAFQLFSINLDIGSFQCSRYTSYLSSEGDPYLSLPYLISSLLSIKTPQLAWRYLTLTYALRYLYSIIDNITIYIWGTAGIENIANLFQNDILWSFQELSSTYSLPHTDFNNYLYIRCALWKSLAHLLGIWL